ncbi:hypothetical protein PO909_008694 [Leuciscus waleckii]
MIGTEKRRDNDCDRKDEAGDRNKTADEDEDDDETDKGKWRKTRPGPKSFVVAIKTKTWKKIKPHAGLTQLQQPWTDVLYEAFTKVNPCCVLAFKYQHVKCRKSRKKRAPYFKALAICIFEDCSAKYKFTIQTKPKPCQKHIDIHVLRIGEVTHKEKDLKFRNAKFTKRGKIAAELEKGVSQHYYKSLRNTPPDEILAGNISRCLSMDVLRVICSEVRKSTRLHDDVIMEMMLCQKIMKECSGTASQVAGYIQHLQVDPFGVHLYTDCGLRILADHLKNSPPVTLHLDATGSVMSRIPNQTKRILYYALVLPGKGKDKPPLPVSEFISNEHSIPTLTFWQMETLRQLGQITTRKVHQVETDFSWALIGSVLLAFNKESVSSYLNRAHLIVSQKVKSADAFNFTVLHLCSSHIIKAVTQGFAKKTGEYAVKEYATYCFGLLLNSTTLQEALNHFQDMAMLFMSANKSNAVMAAKNTLDQKILKSKPTTMDETLPPYVEDMERSSNIKTICGKSPFTHLFNGVLEKIRCTQTESGTNNEFYCPGIINFLMSNYMGIFPLWSGMLLGDLSRFSKESNKEIKTKETNCHVEQWFSIVKNHILHRKRFLRPADFITKMFNSLQGRYTQHQMMHNLGSLSQVASPKHQTIDQQEEQWAKRSLSERSAKHHSKYFDPPEVVPQPKRRKTKQTSEGQSEVTSAQVKALWSKKACEIVVAIIQSKDKKRSYILHHSEMKTLQPHRWLMGETIQCYLHVLVNNSDQGHRIYVLDHYTANVIINDEREKVRRNILSKVDFYDYEGIISFLNVDENHWMFLYLHAASSQVFVIDPKGHDEQAKSMHAASKFREFFKMRRICLNKNDWVDIKWNEGLISHSKQRDGYSCKSLSSNAIAL